MNKEHRELISELSDQIEAFESWLNTIYPKIGCVSGPLRLRKRPKKYLLQYRTGETYRELGKCTVEEKLIALNELPALLIAREEAVKAHEEKQKELVPLIDKAIKAHCFWFNKVIHEQKQNTLGQ